jgi:HlyD family secretion protein
MTRRTRWILGAIGAVVLLFIVYTLINVARGPVVSVTTTTVTEGRIEKTVSASGDTAALDDVDVFSPIQSTVKQVLVSDQQHVRVGEALVVLDPSNYELAHAQAQAGVAAAEAQADGARKQQPTDEDFNAARAAVDAAYQAYLVARNAYLHPHPTINPVPPPATFPPNMPVLKTQMLQAFAAYQQALAALERLDESAEIDPALDAARAAERQAKLAREVADSNLEMTTVRAPISGTVFLTSFAGSGLSGPTRPIQRGQAVSPAQSIVRIVDPTRMKFVADVDEADVAGVKKGEDAQVVLDAFSSDTFKGKVDKVSLLSKTTQSGGSAFSADIIMPRGNRGLRVGMSGTANIIVARRPLVLQIPVEAVVQVGGKNVVYVVEGGRAHKREVELGLSTDTVYEVTSGLKAGEKVVTSGLTGLKDGSRVSGQ